jgi:uncharacterized protein
MNRKLLIAVFLFFYFESTVAQTKGGWLDKMMISEIGDLDGISALNRGDYETAMKIFRPLAEKGNAPSQIYVGEMYEFGHGVVQDYKEAVKWYYLAAEQGKPNAQFILALKYADGKGVTQDYKQAAMWYRSAAEQGNSSAQTNLGVLYGNGKGVAQNFVRAHMWANLAAAQGDDIAIKNRDIYANKMTSSQIAQAQELARDCEKRKYKDCD